MADSLSGTAIGQAAMRAADLKRRVVCSRMVVASQKKTPASHAGKAEKHTIGRAVISQLIHN